MKRINELTKNNNFDNDLLKEYIVALKDADFSSLINKLGLSEDVAKKYTSKLQITVNNLKNCRKCKALEECRNEVNGCVLYPTLENNILRFDYFACKYQKAYLEEQKHKPINYCEPDIIANARMKDIDKTDKKRAHVIKWVADFYNKYKTDKHIKGIYLHGSFGSGKSYILAALCNELAKNGAKVVMGYYPELLLDLKSSFNDDFDQKMHQIRTCDVLLLDDIGAETVTNWSRDEILGTILQYRMDAKLPTFFTSNLNIEELKSNLSNTKDHIDYVKSQRIIERILQLTDDFELVSKDRRK